MEKDLKTLMQWAQERDINLAAWINSIREKLATERAQQRDNTRPAHGLGHVQQLGAGIISTNEAPLIGRQQA